MISETPITILLVDDEAVIAMATKMALEAYGYRVLTAFSGEKAVQAFKTMPDVDLVLMDINLGAGMDGTEAAEVIMAERDLPVVFLSSHTEPEFVAKTEKITSYGYVVKNSSVTVLDASIKMALKLHHRRQSEQEIRRTEARLRILVDILQHHSKSNQEFLDYALSQALELTGSKIGYIYHYREDHREFILNTWSRDVMAECAVANPQTCYELDKTGIWGEAVRQRKPILINDFPAFHPLKKGYPEGHVRLRKFMTVPIFEEGRIVGVVGLANKDADYDETDTLQVSLLMEAVWKVTERRRAEEETERQLAEKALLLREVHHRIKNNIASIGGLLSLHLHSTSNPEAASVLQDALGRINSMRILYDKLLAGESYKETSVKNYLESLADSVIALFPGGVRIRLEARIVDIPLDAKRLFLLGIIVTELMTNIMKHAFAGRETGLIAISLDQTDRRVTLAVRDDGVGLPNGFDIQTSKGFGFALVKMLSQQLKGCFSIESRGGTRSLVEFDA